MSTTFSGGGAEGYLGAVQSLLYGSDLAGVAQQYNSVVGAVLATLWLTELVDLMSGGAMHTVDLAPRDFPLGFCGIIIAPLVNQSFILFLFNLIPFTAELYYLLVLGGLRLALTVSAVGTVLGGFIVWVVGRSGSHHCGTGPLICAYAGYLLVTGIIDNKQRQVVTGAAAFVGWVIMSCILATNAKELAWEGVSFGFVLGAVFGWYTDRDLIAPAASVGAKDQYKPVPTDLDGDDELYDEEALDDDEDDDDL